MPAQGCRTQQLIISHMRSGCCCRLAIQDKPFAAPLRLIAAGLDLHSLPLAPPPFKQEGLTCVPILPGTDTHSTAAAQGASFACCFTCVVHRLGHQQVCAWSAHALLDRRNPQGLNEGVLPHASSTAANQSMIARRDSNVVIKCNVVYSL